MLADMRILRGEDWLQLDCEPHALPALSKNIRMYSIGRDVRLTDVSTEVAILSLIGPAARRRARRRASGEREHSFAAGEHGLLTRTDLGVDVFCPAARAADVAAALGVPRVAEETAECVRVESGRPALRDRHDARHDSRGGRAERARG